MIITHAFKVELDPNNKQKTTLIQHAGAARWAWNWALRKRIDEYESTGKSSNAIEQHRQLNVLKKTPEYAWCYSVSKCVFQEGLRDLDKAYQNFWRGLKNGKRVGFPRFKSKKNGIGSFRLTGSIRVFEDSIQLPRLGVIRLKEHGYIPTSGIKILSATCSEQAGHWFVSVSCEVEVPNPQPATGEPVGIDLGIKSMAIVSDGRTFDNPKALGKTQKKMRRLQRELARRKKGSQNREKTRQKIAKAHYRIANIRSDALHKATSAICAKNKPNSERPSVVVIEDLNVAGMVKNHKLARAISDVGMGEFRRQMGYKTAWTGEQLVVADRFFPSSRLCPACGTINDKLTLADRIWTCDCGAAYDRDYLAACNLRDFGIRTVSSMETGLRANAYREDVRLASASSPRGSRNQTSNLPRVDSSRF